MIPAPNPPPPRAPPSNRLGWWFGGLAALAFGGAVLGWIVLSKLAAPFAMPAACVLALLLGGMAALLLERLWLAPQRRVVAALQAELDERFEWEGRLRHDLRGALSPALLTADWLATNTDPKVKRAGDIMVQAVERAAALIADQPD